MHEQPRLLTSGRFIGPRIVMTPNATRNRTPSAVLFVVFPYRTFLPFRKLTSIPRGLILKPHGLPVPWGEWRVWPRRRDAAARE